MLVAIDGPAGAGKSSVARAAAAALGATYLDTGAMYRCVALARLRDPIANPADLPIELHGERIVLGGEDVSAAIREPGVTELASRVAAEPGVRSAMVDRQRDLLRTGDWVVEGRDIGTVVAPHADVKIFLTADPGERARRRAAQTGRPVDEVLAEQNERDARDASRDLSPLTAAPDAISVDTTGSTLAEVVDRIVAAARATPVSAADAGDRA